MRLLAAIMDRSSVVNLPRSASSAGEVRPRYRLRPEVRMEERTCYYIVMQ